MVNPLIFQIVGYQDSGKTTAMLEVVKRLSSEGSKVATIKHHGHGGQPDVAEKKDSSRHVRAGALASIIEGEGRVVLQAEKSEWSLQEEIQLLSKLSPDLILIEGYKEESYPKAVLLRDEEDIHLLETLNHIEMVYCRDEQLVEKIHNLGKLPVFSQTEQFHTELFCYFKSALATVQK